MTDQDRQRFGIAIAAVAATFRSEATTAMIQGYWMGLQDLPVESVEQALAASLRTSRFMPTAAELRELAGVPSTEDSALLAWASLDRAVSEHGAYQSVDFEDKTINATVRHLGGWERICGLPAEEFDKWLKKEFLRVYEAFQRSGGIRDLEGSLGGIHDRENSALGMDRGRRPALIPRLVPDRLRLQESVLPRRLMSAAVSGE